jgi:hypothetical protein
VAKEALLCSDQDQEGLGATLKKRKPRIRTFFEWLYDREKPPEIFGKDKRDN